MLIRELSSAQEAVRVEELQLLTWGPEPLQVVPRGMLIAIQLQGGLLAGAFDGDEMIGFVLGFPTRDPGVQHSHMTAVLPEYQRTGVALALKAFQRNWCLERGIQSVVWTFDPLRALNANFNVRKLGAVIRRYHPNLYGELSGINAGVPSDRVLAEWPLESERVHRALQGQYPPEDPDAPVVNADAPHDFAALLELPRVRVQLPEDYGAMLREDLPLARQWREHGRAVLLTYLTSGYTVTGFSRSGMSAYLLERGSGAVIA